MKLLYILLALLILAGCESNSYSAFYTAVPSKQLSQGIQYLSYGEEPTIIYSNRFDEDLYALRAKKYAILGYSEFNSSSEKERDAVTQAKKAKATVVILGKTHTGSSVSSDLLLLPSTSISVKGTSVTYDRGLSADSLPTTTNNYDHTAVFLAMDNSPVKLGIIVRPLDQSERRRYGRNIGYIIDVVIENSPAFNSNIVQSDIIIGINGMEIRSISDIDNETLTSNVISLDLMRNGKPITIEVTM